MVRLLAVRASIAALKRAISLSDRHKPATWELLSIGFAALFVLASWSALQFNAAFVIDTHIIVDNKIALEPERGTSGLAFYSLGYSNQDKVYLFNFEHDPTGDCVNFAMSGYSPRRSALASAAKPLLMGTHLYRDSMRLALTSVEDARFTMREPGLPDLERFFRQSPTVIYQASSEGGGSLGKELAYWAQIFGVAFTVLIAFAAQVLMLIGLHRKRAEATLLRLEIEKRRLEIEQLKIALALARGSPK